MKRMLVGSIIVDHALELPQFICGMPVMSFLFTEGAEQSLCLAEPLYAYPMKNVRL